MLIKKKIKSLFFCIATPFILFSNNSVIVDYDYSPFMGSYDLLTLQSMTSSFFLSKNKYPETNALQSLLRFIDLVAFIDPLNLFTTTVQHEIFGHGFRIRTLSNAQVDHYHFNWPWPYGSGGGSTNFSVSEKFSLADNALVSIAGIEAEIILARALKVKALSSSMITPCDISLYQNAQQSLLFYALVTHLSELAISDEKQKIDEGNDIQSYIATMNKMFPSHHLTRLGIETKALLNLLDLMTFYNIYAWWHYVITGKSTSLPTIKIKDVNYLPNFLFSLAPYGLEYGLENYLVLPDEKLVYFYVKAGSYDKTFLGAGCECFNIICHNKLSLGFKGHFWYQPSLGGSKSFVTAFEQQQKTKADLKSSIFGLAFSVVCQHSFNQNKLSLFVELGGKSKGYLPGYHYQAFPTFRLGLSGRF